jgi:hypothetical protein
MKRLVIQEIKNKRGQTYRLKIEEQTNYGNDFAKSSSFFKYKGFILESSHYYGNPSWLINNKLILMPRWTTNQTKRTITNFYFDEEWLEKMRSAVKAYNRRFCNCNGCVERHCNCCPVGK